METGYPKSSKGEARREAIEAEARRMLLDEGYAGVSLRAIASRLGISVGNLQYYFPTKDDLVEAVIAGESQKPIDMLEAVDWTTQDAALSIRRAVGSLMRYYASDAGRFYAIMESLALHDQRYAKLKAKGYAHVFAHIGLLVGLMAPHLTADRCSSLAQILVALIDGAALQVQSGRDGAHGDGLDALIEDLSQAIEQLLVSWD